MKNANLPSVTTISNFPASAAGRSSAVSFSHSDSFKAAEEGGGGGHALPLEETLELSLVRSLLYPKRLELGDWDSDFTLSDHGRLFAYMPVLRYIGRICCKMCCKMSLHMLH